MTSPRRFIYAPFAVVALVLSSCAGPEAQTTSPDDAGPTATPVAADPTPPTSVDEIPEDPTPATTADPTDMPAPTDVQTLEGMTLEFATIAQVAGQPIAVAPHPDGESILIAEKSGILRQWLPQPDGTYEPLEPPVVDLRDRTTGGSEQGLLGLAVAPDGAHFYVVHSDERGNNILLEFGIDGTGERLMLEVDQPFGNHNGGHLAFGPDDLLYYSLGDGGGSGDPLGSGQDRSDLLGSILRIDPNPGGSTYAIPGDNPFVGQQDVRPEIWAYGLRNPWRFSFDRGTGDLWIGDVGQNLIEEIDWLPAANEPTGGAGANLGWASFEGTQPFDGTDAPDAIDPVFEYDHGEGCSIIGGYVARGNHPSLEGAYVFSDFCTRTVWGLIVDDEGNVVDERSLGSVDADPLSFGEGHAAELLVLLASGEVQRITVS